MVFYGNLEHNRNVSDNTRNKYEPYRKKLGKRIKDLRLELGHTQETFALDVVKMNVSYLAKIENGYINTTVHSLIRIAKGLKVEVRNLIEF